MNLKQLEDKLNLKFKKHDTLETAFVHRSYLNENPGFKLSHNERLEFLGDAVLELVVTDFLYRNYDNPEGELTNWRSALVKTESLSEVAEKLGLGEYLRLSKGEERGNGRSRNLILANTTEALIGAIYIDQGYEAASNFIDKNILVRLPKILETKSYIDAKSLFQELAQDQEGITPHYDVLHEEGPDHNKIFTMGVFIGKKKMGEGVGASKQEAQQVAAENALKKYQ